MKRLDWVALICGLLLTVVRGGSAQPAFQNLDFESANVPIVPVGQLGTGVSFSNAFPAWTGYLGTDQSTIAAVDVLTLGAYNIALLAPNWLYNDDTPIIEGNYSAVLQGGFIPPFGPGPVSAAIAQTGLIPATAQSLQMKMQQHGHYAPALDELGVTIGGQNIVMVPLQVTTNYTLYGGDVSAFAGQFKELRIAALPGPQDSNPSLTLDSIEFSPEAIPEPRTLSLITGAFFLAIHIAKRRRLQASRM